MEKAVRGLFTGAGGKNVLDNTGVHPESYGAAEELLALCGFSDEDVRRGAVSQLTQKVQAMGEAAVAEKLGVGVPTLRDVVKELMKPGRDLRSDLPAPILRTDCWRSGSEARMVLTGRAEHHRLQRVARGHRRARDELVHISQVCNKFIKHPSGGGRGRYRQVVVLDVDEKKHRIQPVMKQVKGKRPPPRAVLFFSSLRPEDKSRHRNSLPRTNLGWRRALVGAALSERAGLRRTDMSAICTFCRSLRRSRAACAGMSPFFAAKLIWVVFLYNGYFTIKLVISLLSSEICYRVGGDVKWRITERCTSQQRWSTPCYGRKAPLFCCWEAQRKCEDIYIRADDT